MKIWNTYSKFHLYIVFPFFEISHRRNITFINKFSIKIIHTWEEERNSLIFERCFHVVQTRWSTNGRGGGCTVPPRLFVNLVALREQTNVARHPLGDTRPAARAFYATIINRPGAAHSLSPRPQGWMHLEEISSRSRGKIFGVPGFKRSLSSGW